MEATDRLVSWDKSFSLGKLDNSDFFCPTEYLADLKGRVPEDNAGTAEYPARAQHLELHQLLEGFHFVQIIDTETDTVVLAELAGTSTQHDVPLGELETEEQAKHSRRPLSSRQLDLGYNRFLFSAGNVRNRMIKAFTPETIVKPTNIGSAEPEATFRGRSRMRIIPGKRFMSIEATSEVPGLRDSSLTLHIEENAIKIASNIVLQGPCNDVLDKCRLEISLDPNGTVHGMRAYGKTILPFIGAGLLPEKDPAISGIRPISRDAERAITLQAVSNALGLDRWQDIEIAQTAAELYQRLGEHSLYVASAIVFAD